MEPDPKRDFNWIEPLREAWEECKKIHYRILAWVAPSPDDSRLLGGIKWVGKVILLTIMTVLSPVVFIFLMSVAFMAT